MIRHTAMTTQAFFCWPGHTPHERLARNLHMTCVMMTCSSDSRAAGSRNRDTGYQLLTACISHDKERQRQHHDDDQNRQWAVSTRGYISVSLSHTIPSKHINANNEQTPRNQPVEENRRAKQGQTVLPWKLKPVCGALTFLGLTDPQSLALDGKLRPLRSGEHTGEHPIVHEVQGGEQQLRSIDRDDIGKERCSFIRLFD